MTDESRGSAAPWQILLIIGAVLLSFSPLIRCGFTDWDDQDTIWANPKLQPKTQNVGYYWTHAEAELYIPLTYSVWGGLAHLGEKPQSNGQMGPNPAVFHATSMLLHALSSVFVYLILRRLIRADRAACIGAFLFALHPLQTETVGWASGMKDLLCGFFVLLALWQYLSWLQESSDAPAGRRIMRYLIAMIAVVLGTLCKPTAMIAPLLAFLLDVCFVRRAPMAAIKSLWPWVLAVVPCMVWTKLAQPELLGAAVPILWRPVLALDAIAFYLWKLIWPTGLAIDYGRNPAFTTKQSWIWMTCLVPVALAAWLAATRKRRPMMSGGALLAVAAVLPVLGFVAFEYQTRSTVADHYVYLSMLGVALAAAWAVSKLPTQIAFYAPAIVLTVLALRSMDQTRYWHDSRALFAHAITVNPRSDNAHQNLAVLVGYDAEMSEAKAMIYAEQKDPDSAKAQHTDAINKLAEAEGHLAMVLELKPGNASALHTRAGLRARFGRHEESIADLKTLIAELPKLRADEYELFKHDYSLLGRELLVVHRPEEAIGYFDKMLEIDPTDRAALRGKTQATAMKKPPTTEQSADIRDTRH